jgi:hypothetical protein
VGKLPAAQHRFTAIIGDDAVLPFFRYPLADEASYLTGQPHNVPALLDTQAGNLLTDVPYSTRASEQFMPPAPQPDTALGRVFARRPVSVGAAQGFVAIMDAYEQPLRIGGAIGSAYVFNIRNQVDVTGTVTFDWQASTQPYVQRLIAAGYINQVNVTGGAGQRGFLGWLDAQAGVNWGPNDVGFVLNPLQRNRVALLSSHASHLRNTTPNQRFTAAHVDASAPFPGALFMNLGCHGGYSTGVDQSPAAPDYYNDALVRAALEHYLTYYGATTYGQTTATAQMRYHDQKYLDFLDQLLGKSATTGEAHRQATLAYYTTYPAATHNWKDTEGLYATELYGLPTQQVHAYVPEPVHVSAIEMTASASGDAAAGSGALDLEFRAANLRAAAQGQYTLLEVPGGVLAAVGNGPVIPLLAHTLDFPPGTAVTVSLVASDTAAFGAAVRLPPQQAGSQTFGVETVSFTSTAPYPADPFWTTLYSDAGRVRLAVSVVPLRWDPVTGAVTQFRRMAFRISYSSPETGVAITSLAVNGGQPAQAGQAAIPVTMTLTAAAGAPLQLRWWVEATDGKTRIGSAATITPTAGANAASWNIAGAGLGPGLVTLQAVLEDANGAVAASKWLPFTVAGRGLALTADKPTYRAGDASARLAADVRDENGAIVGGLAGQLQGNLDGQPVGLTWTGNGPYTATLALAPLAEAAHLLTAAAPNSLTGTVSFGIDRQTPTSAAASPAVTHAAAFTVTVAGQDAGSGIALYRMQYRVGQAGAWRDWFTSPAAWDFATGDAPDLTWWFGAGQPVALRRGEIYCFRSQATDGAGNVEPAHAAADTCTQFTGSTRIYLPLVMDR